MIDMLVRALTQNCFLVAALCVAIWAMPERPVDPDAVWKQDYPSKAYYEHRHECWNGPAPSDVEIPTHSIVRTDDSSPYRYVGPKWTTRALEHVFEDKHPHMSVQAFCR